MNGANVSMLRGVVPWVQLPIYPAVGLLTALSPLNEKIRNKRDVLALMARNYGVGLQDLQLIEQETLVIVGEHDTSLLPSHTRAMVQEIARQACGIGWRPFYSGAVSGEIFTQLFVFLAGKRDSR